MSAVSMLEDVPIQGSGAGDGWPRPRQQHLYLVTGRPVSDIQAGAAGSGSRAAAPARTAVVTRPAPVRLTRRGRAVVVALALIVSTIAVTVASMAAAGGAQAANHGRPGAGYAGMRQIVVRPGQTLWSIAAQVEPSADPRLVVAQIMTANAMTGTVIEAGQLLWVPQ
jgi:hypothetical protein